MSVRTNQEKIDRALYELHTTGYHRVVPLRWLGVVVPAFGLVVMVPILVVMWTLGVPQPIPVIVSVVFAAGAAFLLVPRLIQGVTAPRTLRLTPTGITMTEGSTTVLSEVSWEELADVTIHRTVQSSLNRDHRRRRSYSYKLAIVLRHPATRQRIARDKVVTEGSRTLPEHHIVLFSLSPESEAQNLAELLRQAGARYSAPEADRRSPR